MFLLGHWSNYDELESSLSIPEIMATYKAVTDVERRKNKFLAAMQGIDLDEGSEQKNSGSSVSTVEEVQARAVARMTGNKNLAGAVAQGLTPEMGVDYLISEGTEIG